jgi:hypothetical protein
MSEVSSQKIKQCGITIIICGNYSMNEIFRVQGFPDEAWKKEKK